MENTLNTLDVIHEIHASVVKANTYLCESPTDRFNRTVLEMVQKEIESAQLAASHWRYMNPGSHSYTHTALFPLAIYNELSSDFLSQLNRSTDVSIYSDGPNRATIRIQLHF